MGARAAHWWKLLTGRPVGPRMQLAIVASALLAGSAIAQSPAILLWPNGAPGSEGKTGDEVIRLSEGGDHIVSNVHRPSITPYFSAKEGAAKEKSSGAAVIVIPGGGHRELWMDHEGYNVGRFLSDHGVNAFVLKYRLARQAGSTYSIEGSALADAQRAIRLVRSRAAEWGIDPQRIGVIGFSAGGELAALSATRFDAGRRDAADPVDSESSRPAFAGLLYPAIPRDMKIAGDTPPAFLACGENDRPDIAQGLPELYLAFRRAGVSSELHVYAMTGHGFGIRAANGPPSSEWPNQFLQWLAVEGFLKN
jgi:acetyl esterase/lipase